MTHPSKAILFLGAILAAGTLQAPAQEAPAGVFVDPVPIVRIGPPQGFQYAFTDGRLNPNRGVRSERGNAQSAQVWTETVPRREIPLSRQTILQAAQANMATHPGTASGSFVQVASLRDANAAHTAAAQLASADLPVRVQRSGGYHVVLAGPLSTSTDRQRALSTSRALGYSDAFLR